MQVHKQLLISVIMNCYNGERYLREALDSVMAQTYTNWELIFWDNQSVDKSADILLSYHDSRLKYFYAPQHTNLGKARNLAIEKTKGQWLAFLDVDDLWFPEKLEKQIVLIKEEGDDLGLVYGRSEIFEMRKEVNFVRISWDGKVLPEGMIFDALLKENFIPFLSAVVNRKKLMNIGVIPEKFRHSMDYFMFLHLAHHYRARAVQEPCCRYRIHEANLSHVQHVIGAKESIQIVSSFSEYPAAQEALKFWQASLAAAYLRDGLLLKMLKTLMHGGWMQFIFGIFRWVNSRMKYRKAIG